MEEFMTHLVWGSSLSGRDLNWNRKFLIMIGIPNNLPSTQTGNSRWETASLPSLHPPETRNQGIPVLARQCVTSDFVLPWHPPEHPGIHLGKRKMKKSCLTDVMGIFENTGAENQSTVQAQCISTRQAAATQAPLTSSAFSLTGTSSFSLIYCYLPEHPQSLCFLMLGHLSRSSYYMRSINKSIEEIQISTLHLFG